MEAKILDELKNAKSVDDLINIAKNSGLKLDASSAEKIFKQISKGGNVDIGGILKSVLGGSSNAGTEKEGANKSGEAGKGVGDAIGSILKGVAGGSGSNGTNAAKTVGTEAEKAAGTKTDANKNSGAEKAVEDALGSVLKKVVK